jgi:hypothetical protein
MGHKGIMQNIVSKKFFDQGSVTGSTLEAQILCQAICEINH